MLQLLGVHDASELDIQVAHSALDSPADKPLCITLSLTTSEGRVGTVIGSYTNETPQVYDYFLAGAGTTVFVEQNIVRDSQGVVCYPDDEEGRILQDGEFFNAIGEDRPAEIYPDSVLTTMHVLQRAQEMIR